MKNSNQILKIQSPKGTPVSPAISQSQDLEGPSQGLGPAIVSNETRCPITQEPIKKFSQQDVYTTRTGIQYHKPSLKMWLQKADTMPHNNVESPEDIRRLWPHAVNAVTTNPLLMRQLEADELILALLMISSGVLGTLALGAALLSYARATSAPAPNAGEHDRTKSGLLAGIGACLVGASYYFSSKRDAVIAAMVRIEYRQADRPITDIEIEKAALGLDYYKIAITSDGRGSA